MVDRQREVERLDALFDDLWPITRSITGPGLRESLDFLGKHVPLDVEGVPTGTDVFDWTIPREWRLNQARLVGPDGEVYSDVAETNLAVVNYSAPVDRELSLSELEPHLYTDPDVPEATPYVTSYYERNWGFCLPQEVYDSLPEGTYHAYVDSEFVDGELNYGHTILEGSSDREVLLSTYICHPSLANNELSGPLVLSSLYDRLAAWEDQTLSYRFVVAPETIGSLAYLSRYAEQLRDSLVGGAVLTCLGGPRNTLSYKRTRREDALLDDLVEHVDAHTETDFRIRAFDPTTGSDERQYCAPGFNLPVGQFARTVYAEYEEYHTSKDTKAFMGIETLVDSAAIIENVLAGLEYAGFYLNQSPFGEPMLSKRDMYPTVNAPNRWGEEADDTENARSDVEREFVDKVRLILNYADGNHTMIDSAERYGVEIGEMIPVVDQLCEVGLLGADHRTPVYRNDLPDPSTVE